MVAPMALELGVWSPYGPEYPHAPQAQYLDAAFARRRKNDEHVAALIAAGASPREDHRPLQYLHYVAGRGAGKTTVAAIDAVQVAAECPGQRTAWTARTHGEIDEVLLMELAAVCPPSLGLWRVRSSRSARWIEWRSGHVTHLISRNVDNPKRRPGLGLNLMGVWHDEAATLFDDSKFADIDNAVRAPGAPYLFVATTSTPLQNGYYSYCVSSGGQIIHATSLDNPHLSREQIRQRIEMLDDQTAQQEIMGRWVALGGRVWDTFAESPWPSGNLWPADDGFRSGEPWFLAVDLGAAQSAWQIVQYREPRDPVTGRVVHPGKVAVVVAEYCPHGVPPEVIIRDIQQRYERRAGPPVEVLVGHDVNSGGTVGIPAATLFANVGWRYRHPAGMMMDKELQRQVARSLILNTAGERRFAVCAKENRGQWVCVEQHMSGRSVRGIMNMLRNDQYPEPGDKGTFVKDKPRAGKNAVEDDRDSMLYWMICNHPPSALQKTKIGA